MRGNGGRFNGGPACSSFDGALMEVGPLRLVPGSNGQLKEVDAAWNEYANIIFGMSRLPLPEYSAWLTGEQWINLLERVTHTSAQMDTCTNFPP